MIGKRLKIDPNDVWLVVSNYANVPFNDQKYGAVCAYDQSTDRWQVMVTNLQLVRMAMPQERLALAIVTFCSKRYCQIRLVRLLLLLCFPYQMQFSWKHF